jgi:hypothetical protein
MNCAVSGCTKTAKRYGRYCNTHDTRDRRHGHPRQETVRTKDLRPYRDIVRRRIQRNADAAAWQTLETIWRQTVRHCQARLREYLGGKPAIRWERLAWEEIIKLAQAAEPREVIETTAAMVVMQSFDPWRFRSDRAFWFQLVRRVRALAEINIGKSVDPGTGKVKRVYRDLPPRACEALAKIILESIGIAGAKIAQLEQQEQERQADQRTKLYKELEEIV